MTNQDDNVSPRNDTTTPSTNDVKVTSMSTSPTVSKEQEPRLVSEVTGVAEVSKEIEIPEEVEKAGVIARKETVEIPPDLKKLGVKPAGVTTPVATTKSQSAIVLPISDSQVLAGTHAQVTAALRWLAEWCIRKLKKAHLMLKMIRGKVVRVKE